jgi:isoprenylcysteine carboxyl methyltransferase (ICMT) family protein YpbQ
VVLGYALSRLAEWRLHRRNYWILLRYGAEERSKRLTRFYYGLNIAVVPLAFLERAIMGPAFEQFFVQAIGMAFVLLGFVLRFFAIYSARDTWSMACFKFRQGTWPTTVHVNRKIYLEHAARLIEAVGLALVIKALYIIFPFICFTYWVSWRLARAEIAVNSGKLGLETE